MAYNEVFVSSLATGDGDGRDELGLSLTTASYDDLDGGHGSGDSLLYETAGSPFAGLFSGQRIYLSGANITTGLYEIGNVLNDNHLNLTSSAGSDNIGGVLSSSGPFELAFGVNQSPTGSRINVKNDGAYNPRTSLFMGVAATSKLNNKHTRGYNQVIGDLDALTFNADGSLNDSNLPKVDMTNYLFTLGRYNQISSMSFKGYGNGAVVGGISFDDWVELYGCRIENTGSGASVCASNFDNNCNVSHCDFITSGPQSLWVVSMDLDNRLTNCFVINKTNTENNTNFYCLTLGQNSYVEGCLIVGNQTGVDWGIRLESVEGSQVRGCSFYGLRYGIHSAQSTNTHPWTVENCIAYNVSGWLYMTNANEISWIERSNALGNVTTTHLNVVNSLPKLNEIALTANPFVDPDNYNFTLNDVSGGGALCRGAALRSNKDLGALQRNNSPIITNSRFGTP